MQVNDFEWNGKKVLITGASGFVGSWLSSVVARLGATVCGVTRRKVHPFSAYNTLSVKDRIVTADVDVSDFQQVHDLLNAFDPDIIFHLGAIATVPVALRNPRRAYEVNTFGTLNLIEGCRRLQVGKVLVVCSTDHVFGSGATIPPNGYTEDADVHFAGPYDTSKAAMELIVRSYAQTYSSPPNNLAPLRTVIGITRCANVFGKGDVAFRRVIPNFIDSGIRTKQIPLSYTENGRQFIYVSDAVEGYVRFASRLALASCCERQPCTIGHFAIDHYSGTVKPFIRLRELADMAAHLTHATVVRTASTAAWAPHENREQALSCCATYAALAWSPRKTLEEGLSSALSWFQAIAAGNCHRLTRLAEDDLDATVRSF
ncbi:MAG: NAD-dependent epimerase/dehydratase family protein [Deltaproteobacteria bacterium]|nr:NAD-dependent epimerase/dehydratase family protein [Deltaproteobacteria bacterium]